MTEITQAVLLAAGNGLRMRPLTDHTPKPLLKLGHRALLDHALDRLAEAGVQRVVVNAHWQAEQIAAHLAARQEPPATLVRPEADLLDTGGAVAAALAEGLLGAGAFYVANSDSVWLDGPRPALRRLAAALDGSVDGVILVHRTFLVQADVGAGDFFLDRRGAPRRREEREVAPYIYAGVTVATPALFAGFGAGRFSMNQVWDRALAAGRLGAVVHDGLWFHLSRPEDLAEAEHALTAQVTGATT
ncbi:MAG: nucleotidyltransferase family protein [Rhodospirillales bacterium]